VWGKKCTAVLLVRSTTPKSYCELQICAKHNTNVFEAFQILWVPGENNLVVFYLTNATQRHAQAGAAEVRPGGDNDVPEHDSHNAPAAGAASKLQPKRVRRPRPKLLVLVAKTPKRAASDTTQRRSKRGQGGAAA